MDGTLIYLFAAYTAVWVILFGYLLSLARREKRLRADLDAVRRMVEERSSG